MSTPHTTAQCERDEHDFRFPVDSYGVPMTNGRYCSNCDRCEHCFREDRALELLAEDDDAKFASTTSGYTHCQACGGDTIGALCEWCRLGALENNCDPDSISAPDFNTQLLAVWCASGEAIADREYAEARERISGAVVDASDMRSAAIAAKWANFLPPAPTAADVEEMLTDAEPADYDTDRIERNIDDQDERGTGFDRASWGAR